MITFKHIRLFFVFLFFTFCSWLLGSYFKFASSKLYEVNAEDIKAKEEWSLDLRGSFSHKNSFSEYSLSIKNLSLEEILQQQDIYLRNALLEEYAKRIPLDEMESFIDEIRRTEIDLLKRTDLLDIQNKTILYSPLKIWFERDFDNARNYVIDHVDRGLLYDLTNAQMAGTLFGSWMKKDMKGCFSFVTERGNEFWMKDFMTAMPFVYPKEVYKFIYEDDKASQAFPSFVRPYLFTAWYQKNPIEALDTAAALKGEERKLAYSGIIREMIADHPYEAMEIINDEWKGTERQPLLEQAIRTLTMANPDEALSFILQDKFDEEDFVTVYRSFASCLTAEQLNAIVDDQGNKLSKSEREELVIQHLAGQMGGYGLYFGSELGEDEINAKLSLLASLKEGDQITAIKGMVASQDPELALRAYQLLPKKEQSMADQYELLQRLVKKDSFLAAQYYGEYLAGKEIVGDKGFSKEMMQMKGNMMFSEIVDAFYNDDAEAATAWIATLPSEKLRDEASVRIIVKDAVSNPLGALAYLEAINDPQVGKHAFINMTQSLASEDPKALAQVLLHTKHDDWAENGVTYSLYQASRISEDYTLNLIEDLAENPKLQNDARRRYVNILEKENPKLALEISLEMIPGKETDSLIESTINSFLQKDPQGAKQWLIENGIK